MGDGIQFVVKNVMKINLKNLKPTEDEYNFLAKVLVDMRNNYNVKNTDIKCFGAFNSDIYFDVDNTLIMFLPFVKKRKDKITLRVEGSRDFLIDAYPHKKHIKTLKHLSKNNRIICWSKAGRNWAKKVCDTLKIDKYVNLYLNKPMFYFDDLDVNQWFGKRIWMNDK